MTTSAAQAPTRARISRRIGSIAESATLAVDAKAKALKAAGRPVIGFGAGEPDFPTPDYIVAAAEAACHNPRNHRYTPAAGLPELREAIAAKTLRDSGVPVSAGQVLVTNGGKQAVYQAFATLLDPGDEALLPAPYWTTYPEAIRLAGGVPVEVLADETQGYRVAVDQLERARTERTKALLLRSPSNPTGAVLLAGGDPRDRAVGLRARRLGRDRRDLRAPGLRRRRGSPRCWPRCPSWPRPASWSTVWPRPTR
jgi:aspartate aminotransferase